MKSVRYRCLRKCFIFQVDTLAYSELFVTFILCFFMMSNSPLKYHRKCIDLNCKASKCELCRREVTKYFEIPKDRNRRNRWLIICGRKDLIRKEWNGKKYYVCNLHFAEKSIRKGQIQRLQDGEFPLPGSGMCSHLQRNVIATISERKGTYPSLKF